MKYIKKIVIFIINANKSIKFIYGLNFISNSEKIIEKKSKKINKKQRLQNFVDFFVLLFQLLFSFFFFCVY